MVVARVVVVDMFAEWQVGVRDLLWARQQIRWSIQSFVAEHQCGPRSITDLVSVGEVVVVVLERSGEVRVSQSCRVVRCLDPDPCRLPDVLQRRRSCRTSGAAWCS